MSNEPVPPNKKGFTLAELIESTADELRAIRDKKVNDPVMGFRGCEIELAVTLKAEAGGGFKFWVVEASGKLTGETVSKIKLQFGPLDNTADTQIASAFKSEGIVAYNMPRNQSFGIDKPKLEEG